MKRYYFHLKDGRDYPDFQGTLLPDLHAAKLEAVRFAGDLLSHRAEEFWNSEAWEMHVTDASGGIILTLVFTASVADGHR